eukprot:gnl/TRDRNA2_/TRDRNA2_183804_c0_seq1.p1 gnl/TRDRNA2_/TRDRNA2_183804_c0~~gnl/TRDRNA2_/TRDRNA2_183804_c0_seq1.p1  ORF type:complete len:297 (+),score=64.72 gnl/TRDRNA2_/TRDRNA2_183804_c0_seq1:75-965(+)
MGFAKADFCFLAAIAWSLASIGINWKSDGARRPVETEEVAFLQSDVRFGRKHGSDSMLTLETSAVKPFPLTPIGLAVDSGVKPFPLTPEGLDDSSDEKEVLSLLESPGNVRTMLVDKVHNPTDAVVNLPYITSPTGTYESTARATSIGLEMSTRASPIVGAHGTAAADLADVGSVAPRLTEERYLKSRKDQDRATHIMVDKGSKILLILLVAILAPVSVGVAYVMHIGEAASKKSQKQEAVGDGSGLSASERLGFMAAPMPDKAMQTPRRPSPRTEEAEVFVGVPSARDSVEDEKK